MNDLETYCERSGTLMLICRSKGCVVTKKLEAASVGN